MNDADYVEEIASRLSPRVLLAIVALDIMLPDQRPTWKQCRTVAEVAGAAERPVCAAFGYLVPSAAQHERYGYFDMLEPERAPGFLDLDLSNYEINAAYELFLIGHHDLPMRHLAIANRP